MFNFNVIFYENEEEANEDDEHEDDDEESKAAQDYIYLVHEPYCKMLCGNVQHHRSHSFLSSNKQFSTRFQTCQTYLLE